MRRLFRMFTTGVVLAAVSSAAMAQSPTPGAYQPYRPVYSNPNPSCLPGTVPGTVMPGTPITPGTILPGTVMPGRPQMPGTTTPLPLPSTPGSVMPAPLPSTPTPSTPTPTPSAPTPAAPPSVSSAEAGAGSALAAGTAPESGSGARGTAAPNMIGDLGAHAAVRTLISSGGVTRFVNIPQGAGGSFKITENESPRPQDRVFVTYNYFNNLSIFGPGGVVGQFDLHRETFGFEKTFLDGDASVGARLPILQKDGIGGVGIDGFGDLSVILKYAFVNDNTTGNVLSAGLVVTAPTGRALLVADGQKIHSTLLQPYAGFIYNADRFYAQGFSAVVLPSDSRDTTFLSNDIAVGYRLYQAGEDTFLTSLTPTIEGHLNTPLSNRSSSGDVYMPDSFVVTGGVHLGLWNRAFLTIGAAVPLTGPKPFDFEAVTQFNLKF